MRLRYVPVAVARMTVCLLAGLTAVAVILGRGAPEASTVRIPAAVRQHAINWYLLGKDDPRPAFLDSETGALTRSRLADFARLEYASCSPWRDDRGEYQVVGLWNGSSEDAAALRHGGMGLARYAFPGGRLLDRVPTEMIPASAPCWLPGTSASVLFAATDGRLYRFGFEPDPGYHDEPADEESGPRRVVWRCRPPGVGEVWVGDPHLPSDPRLAGKLVVSLRIWEQATRTRRLSRAELWWLEINSDGTEIVGAGRLTPRDTGTEEHWPVVGARSDGGMTLAYLVRRDPYPGWRLQVVPLVIDRRTGAPRVSGPPMATAHDACSPGPPAFSANGEWLNILTGDERSPAHIERLAVEPRLARESLASQIRRGGVRAAGTARATPR